MRGNLLDRRSVLTGLGAAGGRGGQAMVNQSTNAAMIESETGLIGVGEGGEPRTMDECASMPIGEYDTYLAGMLMNRRPDGSFMNW
jgi:hypothetical protein